MKDTILVANKVQIENIEAVKTFSESITEPSIIIAISAIVVSLLSIFFSIRQNHITLKRNKHINNQLNKPLLNIKYRMNETDGLLLIELLNNGIGPAIINNMYIGYKDKRSENFVDFTKDVEIPGTTSIVRFEKPDSTKISKGVAIASKENIKIFSSVIICDDLKNLQAVFKYFGQLEFHIEYTDIFNNDINPLIVKQEQS